MAALPDVEHPPSLADDLVRGVASLLRSETAADLHVECRGREFWCHTLVLRLRCPPLLRDLERAFEEVDDDGRERRDSFGCRRLTLPSLPSGLSPEAFDTLLAFCYTDELSDGFAEAQLASLVEVSERYGLPRLLELCERQLQARLTPETAHGALALAEEAGAARLLRAAEEFLAAELDACVAAGAFSALAPSRAAAILCRRFALPLVPAVRRPALPDAVIDALLDEGDGQGVDPKQRDERARACDAAAQGGELDGCGCSALEAALWCNREQTQVRRRRLLFGARSLDHRRSEGTLGSVPNLLPTHALAPYARTALVPRRASADAGGVGAAERSAAGPRHRAPRRNARS